MRSSLSLFLTRLCWLVVSHKVTYGTRSTAVPYCMICAVANRVQTHSKTQYCTVTEILRVSTDATFHVFAVEKQVLYALQ